MTSIENNPLQEETKTPNCPYEIIEFDNTFLLTKLKNTNYEENNGVITFKDNEHYEFKVFPLNFNKLDNFINGIFTDFNRDYAIRETDPNYDYKQIIDYIKREYKYEKDDINEYVKVISGMPDVINGLQVNLEKYESFIDILRKTYPDKNFDEFEVEYVEKLKEDDFDAADYIKEKFEIEEFENLDTIIQNDITMLVNKIDVRIDSQYQPIIDENIEKIKKCISDGVEYKNMYIHKEFIKNHYGYINDRIETLKINNEDLMSFNLVKDGEDNKFYYMYYDALLWQIKFIIFKLEGDDPESNPPDMSDVSKENLLAGIYLSTITTI